jgi:hypothetical protein
LIQSFSFQSKRLNLQVVESSEEEDDEDEDIFPGL